MTLLGHIPDVAGLRCIELLRQWDRCEVCFIGPADWPKSLQRLRCQEHREPGIEYCQRTVTGVEKHLCNLATEWLNQSRRMYYLPDASNGDGQSIYNLNVDQVSTGQQQEDKDSDNESESEDS